MTIEPQTTALIERSESDDEPCLALTPGCCVDHAACDHECATW